VGTSRNPNKQFTIRGCGLSGDRLGLHAFEAVGVLQPLRRAVLQPLWQTGSRFRTRGSVSGKPVSRHRHLSQRIFDTETFTTRSARVTDYAFYVQTSGS
jgi:hypothetical protein